jgi:hypothetical protein
MFGVGHRTDASTTRDLSEALSGALERLIIETHRNPEEPPTLYIDSKGRHLTSQASVSQDNPAAVTVTYDCIRGQYRVFPGREASNSNYYRNIGRSEGDSDEVVRFYLMSGVTELQSGAEVVLAVGRQGNGANISLRIEFSAENPPGLELSARDVKCYNIWSKPYGIPSSGLLVVEIGRAQLTGNKYISTVQLTLEACPSTGKVIVYPGKLPPGRAQTIEGRLAEAPFRETTYLREGENFRIGGVSVSLPKLVDSIAKLGTSPEKAEYLRRLLEDISKSNIETTAKITRLTEGDPATFLTALGYRVHVADINARDDLKGLFNLPKFNPDTKEFHLPRFNASELQKADSNLLSAIADKIRALYEDIFLHLALPQPSSPPQKPS